MKDKLNAFLIFWEFVMPWHLPVHTCTVQYGLISLVIYPEGNGKVHPCPLMH